MPLTIQTLAGLRQQRRSDFALRLLGADVSLRRSVINVLADTDARGQFDVQATLAAWYARQLFTATKEDQYLEIEAGEFGIVRQGATAAAGNAIFSGTSGIVVPSGTPLQTSDGSAQFVTTSPGTLSSGTVTVPIIATTLGIAGNLPAAAPLTITTSIGGVVPTAVLDGSGATGGTDQETDASLRARLLARKRLPPQGGAWWDYVAWAKNVAGVTRVWVYPLAAGLGEVDVSFVMDGRVNNIPLSADVTAVQAAIDAARPVTASVNVFAPTADALAITVHGLNPGGAAQQAAVIAELNALVRTVAPGGALFGDGVSSIAPGGALYLSQIEAAIEAAGGVGFFDLAAPLADVTYATGHVPATPAVTFT